MKVLINFFRPFNGFHWLYGALKNEYKVEFLNIYLHAGVNLPVFEYQRNCVVVQGWSLRHTLLYLCICVLDSNLGTGTFRLCLSFLFCTLHDYICKSYVADSCLIRFLKFWRVVRYCVLSSEVDHTKSRRWCNRQKHFCFFVRIPMIVNLFLYKFQHIFIIILGHGNWFGGLGSKHLINISPAKIVSYQTGPKFQSTE